MPFQQHQMVAEASVARWQRSPRGADSLVKSTPRRPQPPWPRVRRPLHPQPTPLTPLDITFRPWSSPNSSWGSTCSMPKVWVAVTAPLQVLRRNKIKAVRETAGSGRPTSLIRAVIMRFKGIYGSLSLRKITLGGMYGRSSGGSSCSRCSHSNNHWKFIKRIAWISRKSYISKPTWAPWIPRSFQSTEAKGFLQRMT